MLLVAALRSILRSWSTNATVAFAMTAPCGSVIWPEMDPVCSCAYPSVLKQAKMAKPVAARLVNSSTWAAISLSFRNSVDILHNSGRELHFDRDFHFLL